MIGHCTYCGQSFGKEPHLRRTKDHIVPKSLGGSHLALNRVYACRQCNQFKADHTPGSLRAQANRLEQEAVRARTLADRIEEVIAERAALS